MQLYQKLVLLILILIGLTQKPSQILLTSCPTLREAAIASMRPLRFVFSALLISGMFFVSRKGAKARRINILFLLNISIHPAFMQRRFFMTLRKSCLIIQRSLID
ncbi:hypothetical protein [Nostoc sp. FACHB-110]|uniref:hypothetical protein n=1 Tax=Nostoc sp. FACHB-110 TaxID=2692834 RepID=UPI001689001E|nr:hypothetical protein [Nostoc sp. FACHB-110]MBD2436791.1 hypothetical protein [Nostoc sp. FACHB-110]